MDKPKIKTDHKWKNFSYRDQVPKTILMHQFDYLDKCSDGFLVYRGHWYHLSEFMRVGYPGPFGQTDENGYHGHISHSYSSGVLIRISKDGEQYQIATYQH